MHRLIHAHSLEDGKRWNIPFYHINLQNIDTNIRNKKRPLGIEKNELKVGDKVGFKNQDNEEVYGKVIRLNQKTVTIEVPPKQQWRVSYSLLFLYLMEKKDKYKSISLAVFNSTTFKFVI